MNLRKLTKQIQENFHHGNFANTISLIDEYLTIPGFGMYDMLAYYYGVSLMEIGSKKTAFKYLDMAYTLLSKSSIMKIRVANCYRHYNEYQKAKNILEELIADDNYQDFTGYFVLAKIEFYAGNYERALELFAKASLYSKNPDDIVKIENFQKRAEEYLKAETKKIDYQAFMANGKELEIGHIIYIKVPSQNVKESSSDNYFYKRTYLITNINNNVLTTVSLSNSPSLYSFCIPKELSHSLDDKYAVYGFKTLDISQVESVVGKLDLIFVKELLYHLHTYYHDLLNIKKPFSAIQNYTNHPRSILPNNVIVIYGSNNEEEYHFVIDITEKEYKTVKLKIENGCFLPDNEFASLGFDTYIFDVIPLKSNIISTIYDNIDFKTRS